MQSLIDQFIEADNYEDWGSAMQIAEQAVFQHPNDAGAWALRARAHWRLGDTQAADADVSRALSIDPQCGLAIATQAGRVFDEGDARTSARMLDDAIKRVPPHANLHIARGFQRMQTGDHRGAIQDFKRAIELAPNYQRSYVNTASLLTEAGHADEALEFWDQAARTAPGNGQLAYNAGTALFQAEHYDRALAHLDRARQLLGERNDVQMNRASALQRLGRHQEAIDEWLSLYQREPDWDWVLRGLAESYYRLGDLENARRYSTELDRVDGGRAGAVKLGWLLFHDKRSEELIAHVQPLLTTEPMHPEFGQMMGMSLRRLERHDEALDWMERNVAQNPQYHYARGDLAKLLSEIYARHDEALAHIQTAMTLGPDSSFYPDVHAEILERINGPKKSASKGGFFRRLFGG